MTVIIEIVFIVIFSILIRLLFGVSGKKNVLDDTFNHLYYINTQKGHKYFNFNFEGSIIKSNFGYPRFQHWIISRFPKDSWLFIGQTLNMIYEIVYIILLYVLSIYLFKDIDVSDSNISIISLPAWVALLFSSSPILFPYSSARLTGIGSARSLGNLLILGLFISWMQVQVYNDYYYLIIGFILVCSIILSSLFAIQVMFFIFLFLSLLYLSVYPILFILGSSTIAYFIPIGCKIILNHKYNHQKWYFRTQSKVPLVDNRNDIKDFLFMPIYFFRNRNVFYHKFFTQFTFLIAIYSIPSIILYIYFFRYSYSLKSLEYYNFIFLSSICTFCLISFKKMSFLGEAERYFEYSIAFLNIIIVYLFGIGLIPESILFFTFLVQMSIVLITFLYKNKDLLAHNSFVKEDSNTELEQLVKFLYSHENINILTIPIKHGRFLAYKTFKNKSIKYYQRFMDSKDGFKSFTEETKSKSIELPIDDLTHFKTEYNIEYVLFLKSYSEYSDELVQEYDLSKNTIAFENNSYRIYQV